MAASMVDEAKSTMNGGFSGKNGSIFGYGARKGKRKLYKAVGHKWGFSSRLAIQVRHR